MVLGEILTRPTRAERAAPLPGDGGGTRMHLRLRLAPLTHRVVAERLGGLFDQLTVMGLVAGLRERVRAAGDTARA